MKSILKALLPAILGAFVVSAAAPAFALVDLRAHYGLQMSSDTQSLANSPELSNLDGIGADIIVSLPLFPFGFGLRYENLEAEESNAVANYKVDMTRVSAIANMRLIDTLLFVGAIGTVGLSHSGTRTFGAVGSEETSDVEIGFSYTVGVEAGAKLLGWLVGAELGYSGMKIDSSGTTGETDLSGVYAKALVGFAF